MSVVDDFLKKMKMVSEDDYDDYDEYDEYDDEEDDEILSPKKSKVGGLFKGKSKAAEEKEDLDDYEDDLDDYDDEPETSAYSAPRKTPAKPAAAPARATAQSGKVVGMKQPAAVTREAEPAQASSGNPEVCMVMPKSYADANSIADILLSHRAVVLNLEGIDMAAAQRIIDFASGACYTVGGSLQRVSKKIFIAVPNDMTLTGDFDQMVGEMVDLNAVNMMK